VTQGADLTLESEVEKQILLKSLKPKESAELLVHSMPRNLTSADLPEGQRASAPLTWDSTMVRLSSHPTLLALGGQPKAIRILAARLSMENTDHTGRPKLLGDLQAFAESLSRPAAPQVQRPAAEPVVSDRASALGAAAAATAAREEHMAAAAAAARALAHDPKSAALWARLSHQDDQDGGKPLRAQHLVRTLKYDV